MTITGHEVFSSCSIGIVNADSQFHHEPADLLRDADAAMYRVKSAGRDSHAVFNQEVRREVSDQVEREGALRNALKRTDELLPSYSMTRPDFASDVLALLAQHRVSPSRICLELTEGALVAEPAIARQTLQQLADSGMSVVLDDFGAGFSSLSYVHQYRFSGLKIDKSFILELTTSSRSRAIVRAIVRMAESLDLSVVAEGVEDEATLDLLREMGAGQAQGYHFAKPMGLEALLASSLLDR